jgi:hypothetical protein
MRHQLGRGLLAGILLAGAIVIPLEAQMVQGELHDARSGAPIAGAEMKLISADGAVVASGSTGYAGEFFLRPPVEGTFRIQTSMSGYRPGNSATFELGFGDTLTVKIQLSNLVFVLDTIAVVAPNRSDHGGPHIARAFYDRMNAANFGVFITRADIQDRRPARTTDLLRTIPGIQLGATRGEGFTVRVRGDCTPTVYIDGTRAHLGGMTLDDLVRPGEIEGIEVYRSVSEAPPQYRGMNAGCSAVLIWTRIGN